MKKLVNKVSDLPEFFSTDLYEPMFDFQIEDWVENLESRCLRNYMWSLGDYYAADCKNSAEAFIRSPIFPSRSDLLDAPGLRKHIARRQVKDQTVHDALCGHYWFDRESERMREYTEKFDALDAGLGYEEDSFRRNFDALQIPMWEALRDNGITDDGDVFIQVNIHASEAQLIDDFRHWLISIREARGLVHRGKRLVRANFDEWARFMLLPYIDLTFWAKANNLEITNQVLGVVLFSDEFEISLADRIRKVVAPMADRIVTEEFCDLLRAQAIEEREAK